MCVLREDCHWNRQFYRRSSFPRCHWSSQACDMGYLSTCQLLYPCTHHQRSEFCTEHTIYRTLFLHHRCSPWSQEYLYLYLEQSLLRISQSHHWCSCTTFLHQATHRKREACTLLGRCSTSWVYHHHYSPFCRMERYWCQRWMVSTSQSRSTWRYGRKTRQIHFSTRERLRNREDQLRPKGWW